VFSLWTSDGKQSLCFRRLYIVCKCNKKASSVDICMNWKGRRCMLLSLCCCRARAERLYAFNSVMFESVSRNLAVWVFSNIWCVWSRSGKHGSQGSLKADNVLGVFGPFSFWLHYKGKHFNGKKLLRIDALLLLYYKKHLRTQKKLQRKLTFELENSYHFFIHLIGAQYLISCANCFKKHCWDN
jgi:hypothetical protein